MLLMHIVAFSENTGMKQALSFLIFFPHTLWTFMSSKALWLLSHVVCPGECMEGKKKPPNAKALFLLFLSLHHCNLTLLKVQHSAGHGVFGIQTTLELLRESIQHLLKILKGGLRLGLAKTLEFNNVFPFYDKRVYIRLSSSLSVKILPKIE